MGHIVLVTQNLRPKVLFFGWFPSERQSFQRFVGCFIDIIWLQWLWNREACFSGFLVFYQYCDFANHVLGMLKFKCLLFF